MVANIASNVKDDSAVFRLYRSPLRPSSSPPISEVLAAGLLTVIDEQQALAQRLDKLDDALREDTRLAVGMDEAARRIGISRRLLDTLVAAGEVRSFKSGARRLIPVDALEDYVARKAREGRS